MTNEYKPGSGVYKLFQPLEEIFRVGGQVQSAHDHTVALGNVHPGKRATGMFLVSYDYLVAGLPVETCRHYVDTI